MMLILLRSVHISNLKMHTGQWERIFGRRLCDITVGIIGAGRIGTRLLRFMNGFGKIRILAITFGQHLVSGHARQELQLLSPENAPRIINDQADYYPKD
jgi:phosphoglycerate dehydrogenase-like enzyme